MTTRNILSIALGLLVLLFSGCATRYSVHVDALSADQSGGAGRGTTYELKSKTPGVETTDLFFKEVARHVKTALEEAGYRQAGEEEAPDLNIYINSHLSEPLTETREYSEPVYYQSRGYVRTVRIPVVGPDGKVIRYAHRSYWTGGRTMFAGYVDRDRQVTVYDKILKLSAEEPAAEGTKGEEIWALSVRLRSQSTDYRSALPFLLLAAEPYIGNRTEGEIIVTVSEDEAGLNAYRSSVPDGG